MLHLLTTAAGIALIFLATQIDNPLLSALLFFVAWIGYMIIIPIWLVVPSSRDGWEDRE